MVNFVLNVRCMVFPTLVTEQFFCLILIKTLVIVSELPIIKTALRVKVLIA